MEAGEVAVHLPGAAVGELHLPQQPGPEVAALQQVVRQDRVVRKAAVQAGVEGVHREHPFAGVGALVKEVMVHVAGGGAVGVNTPQSSKNFGKEGLVRRLQLHRHPRLEQGVAGGDDPPPGVDHRLVQGMEHGPGQLPGGAHVQAGVRVQGYDILYLPQPALFPHLHLQTGVFPLQQADQLGERPPLSLPAHVALVPPAESRGAEEQIEAPAVFLVEGVHRLTGAVHPGSPLRPHGGVAVRQVGQNAQPELRPGVPVGQAVALQQGGQLGTAVLPGEKGHHHTQSAALPGNAPLQLHPGHGAGRDQTDQEEVQHIFYDIGQGQEEQNGGQRGPCNLPQGQGGQKGQSQHRPGVAHPGALPLRSAQRLPVEIPAHMPAGALPLLGQLHRPSGGLPLLQAVFLRQPAYLLPVAAAGILVHVGVVAGGVLL